MKVVTQRELNLNDDNATLIPMLLERLEELSNIGGFVQVQPIGMMRISLNKQNNNQEGLFLHIWAPDLPIQATGGPFAHTHVFDLESKVIRGEITDTTYTPISNKKGNFKIVKGLCLQDYCSLDEEIIDRVEMEVETVRKISAGTAYRVPKGKFHLTNIGGDGLAITIMKKSNVENASPLLAIQNNVTLSKEHFDRNQLDQRLAWKRVKKLIMSLRT